MQTMVEKTDSYLYCQPECAFRDMTVDEKIGNTPKTRYYGSKKRLQNWLYSLFVELKFDTVFDGFGGTGSVSLLLKAMGKKVFFCDVLKSNTISARAILNNKLPFEDIDYGYRFISDVSPEFGIVTKTFSGKYFTDDENSWIDGAVNNINKLNSNDEKDIFLYCLFQSCLMKRPFNLFHRANLNLRTNQNVKRSFGNHTTWNHGFDDLMKQHLLSVFKSKWCSCHEPVIRTKR
jgi:adenine-specific DNA-methyltransferase